MWEMRCGFRFCHLMCVCLCVVNKFQAYAYVYRVENFMLDKIQIKLKSNKMAGVPIGVGALMTIWLMQFIYAHIEI